MVPSVLYGTCSQQHTYDFIPESLKQHISHVLSLNCFERVVSTARWVKYVEF